MYLQSIRIVNVSILIYFIAFNIDGLASITNLSNIFIFTLIQASKWPSGSSRSHNTYHDQPPLSPSHERRTWSWIVSPIVCMYRAHEKNRTLIHNQVEIIPQKFFCTIICQLRLQNVLLKGVLIPQEHGTRKNYLPSKSLLTFKKSYNFLEQSVRF